MKVKIEAFEVYPAGVYPVTVREIVLDADSQYGAQFRFKFEMGGPLNGKTLTGWCKQSGSVKSKFFEWYAALTGTAPKAGDEVDTDLLIGRTAQAVLKVKTNDDGTQKNTIDSLLPNPTGTGTPSETPATIWARYVEANHPTKDEMVKSIGMDRVSDWLKEHPDKTVYDAIELINRIRADF